MNFNLNGPGGETRRVRNPMKLSPAKVAFGVVVTAILAVAVVTIQALPTVFDVVTSVAQGVALVYVGRKSTEFF